MTRAEATAQAQTEANRLQEPMQVWAHVGGPSPKGPILASGRHLARSPSKRPPRWAWQLVETVAPETAGI